MDEREMENIIVIVRDFNFKLIFVFGIGMYYVGLYERD